MRSNGTVITSHEDILADIETFYKNVYSCYDKELQDVDIETTIDKNYIRVLDENMSNNLEGYITNEEALLTLENMKNNKSPGSDGFFLQNFLDCFGRILDAFY